MSAFIGKLLGVVKQIPLLVAGAQAIFGKGTGTTKAAYVQNAVSEMIGVVEAVAGKDIMDEKAFVEGLDLIREGVVKVMKASVLYEGSKP